MEKLFFPTGKIYRGNRAIFREVNIIYNLACIKYFFRPCVNKS